MCQVCEIKTYCHIKKSSVHHQANIHNTKLVINHQMVKQETVGLSFGLSGGSFIQYLNPKVLGQDMSYNLRLEFGALYTNN